MAYSGGGQGGRRPPLDGFWGGRSPPPRFSESCLKEKSLKGQIFVQRIHQYWIYYSNYILWCYRLFFIQSIPQKSVICVLDPLIIINRFCGTPCWYMKLNFNDIKGAMKVKQTFSSWPYSQMNHVESFNSFTSYQYFFTIKTIYLLSKWYTDNRYVYGD